MDYIALGCMSGTSLDGIDLSLIRSDGETLFRGNLELFSTLFKGTKKSTLHDH